MKRSLTRELGLAFWSEVVLAWVASALAVVTLAWPDWIERVLGVDPDGHSGGAEWAVVAICVAVALTCVALARRTWRAMPARG